MIQTQSAPFILILSTALVVLSGVVTLAWGRKFPRNGDWFVGLTLAVLAAALIFSGNALVEEGTRSHTWLRGWIWPVDKEGAIAAGIIQDAVGLIFSGLGVVFAGILLAGVRPLPSQPRPERTHSAIAFAAAGCVLSWTALSPWLALLGVSLVILGGFLALGSRWDSEAESELAIRFFRKRAFGLGFAVLGACGLAGGRTPLLWSAGSPWLTEGATLPETLGAVFLLIGLLIQFQPFPFLSWVVTPGRTAPWIRVSLAQIFPSWAAFAILLRLHSSLGAGNIFTVFGWIMVGSTLLAILSGVLQTQWRPALGAWLSAGATLSAAILCLGSPQPALALMIALSLGGAAFACCQSALEAAEDAPSDDATVSGGTVAWAKSTGFAGIAAAVGTVGFVSSGAIYQWFTHAWHDPVQLAAAITLYTLFAVLGWKLAWMISRRKVASMPHWSAITIPTLLVLLCLGIIWTGEILGGSLPGGADHVASSLMDLVFAAQPSAAEDGPTVFGAYFGALVVSLLAAYWVSLRVREATNEGFTRKAYEVIVSGYSVNRVARRVMDGITWATAKVDAVIEKRVWGDWIPKGVSIAIRSTASAITRADAVVSSRGRKLVAQCVDSPAKFLQLIQNGDVQWYLLFGLGSGLAILAHYLFGAGVPR